MKKLISASTERQTRLENGVDSLCNVIVCYNHLLHVHSMWEGYAFGFVYIRIMCVSKNMTFASYSLKISTKISSAAFSLNFQCLQALLERVIHGFLNLRVLERALYGIVRVSPSLFYPSISTSWPALNLTCTVIRCCLWTVAVMLE